MKSYGFLLMTLLLAIILCTSCKKERTTSLASLNIINANADQPSVLVYLTGSPGDFYQNQSPVGYGSAHVFTTAAGENPVNIFSAADTSKPIIQTGFDLRPGDIYSLFLSGNSARTDTLLLKDMLPENPIDKSSLRIINLSFDSPALTVNKEGSDPSQSEFGNLSYRQISAFKSYNADPGGGAYNFELRNQATGELLSSFSWYYAPSKTNTIIISGSVDPASATPLTIFQVNNY